jgi:hypothetical protein
MRQVSLVGHYCTTSVKGIVREIASLVATKLTVYVPCGVSDVGGGVELLELPPPPQPKAHALPSEIASRNKSFRVFERRKRPRSPHSGSKIRMANHGTSFAVFSLLGRTSAACCPDVEIITITFKLAFAKFAVVGLMVQAAFGGKFAQLNVTCPVNPPSGAMLRL